MRRTSPDTVTAISTNTTTHATARAGFIAYPLRVRAPPPRLLVRGHEGSETS